MDLDGDTNRFMDSLLFRHIKRVTTASEDEMVLQWQQGASENESYYLELVRLLELAERAAAGADDVPPPPRAGELIAHGPTLLPTDRAPLARRRAWIWGIPGLSLVALAGAAGVFLLVLPTAPEPPAEPLAFGAQEFASGPNEPSTIHLRDGTLVRLAPHSRIRLTGSEGVRQVTLDGRAYFAVAKVPGRPFTVRSRGGEAVVLGTRFEADATGDEMRLLVVEGTVALGPAGGQVMLAAGEMARSVEGAVSAPVKVDSVPSMLSWVGDFLVFQDTPVRRVAAEIEEHFGIPVDVLGDEAEGQTVTAWFGDSSAQDVVGVVCKVLAARCSISEDEAVIDLTGANVNTRRTTWP